MQERASSPASWAKEKKNTMAKALGLEELELEHGSGCGSGARQLGQPLVWSPEATPPEDAACEQVSGVWVASTSSTELSSLSSSRPL